MFGQYRLNVQRDQLLSTPSTNLGCLRVVPLGKKSRQKVVIGDTVGVVHCFSVDKHHEVSFTYQSVPMNKPITRVQMQEDKAFVSSGEKITAFTKKGREFFCLETNLSELITSLQVRNTKIWTAGTVVLTLFEDGKEMHFTMFPDRINDIISDTIPGNDTVYETIAACQDRTLRVVRGADITTELPTEGAVTCLAPVSLPDGTRQVLYGTLNGVMAAVKSSSSGLTRTMGTPRDDARHAGAIVSMHVMADYMQDGTPTVFAARDDGKVDIYTIDPTGNTDPLLIHTEGLVETVTGLDGGFIVSTQKPDVVCNTYSGKVVALVNNYDDAQVATEPVVRTSTTSGAARPQELKGDSLNRHEETQRRIATLKKELEELKLTVDKKKTDYNKNVSEQRVAIAPSFTVKDRFVLESNAAWILTLELNTPIDSIIVQSDIDMELLDNETNAIQSPSNINPALNKTTKVLTLFRLSETSHRFELRMRAQEGVMGTLRTLIIPSTEPKAAQLRTYTLKPLSLHQRCVPDTVTSAPGPVNTLKLTGTFSANDMHAWVSQIVPEVSGVVQGEDVTMAFKSTFQDTTLLCHYRKGEAEFTSNNITTLAIIKEVATREATLRKIQIKIAMDFKPETIVTVLDLLHPKLSYQHDLSARVKLIEALKEIEMQEQDITFMAKTYQDTLKNARALEEEMKVQPKRLEFLCNIVRRLMFDVVALRGENGQSRLPTLNQCLENYELPRLKEFFRHV
eukprot:PhM_4_TR5427/c1_g1_i1/m.69387/K16749/BBS7; Bardet-Biedl syndrome 7 protein